MDIRKELFDNADLKYKEFHKKLVPTVDENTLLGVRLPVMRKIAKKAAAYGVFPKTYYYEEKMIFGLIIGYGKFSIEKRAELLKEFIPLIDNWAVCDSVCASLKFTDKNKEFMWNFIQKYLASNKEYELRFAIVMILDYFIDNEYLKKSINAIKAISSKDYYVQMAAAWTVAEIFIKHPEEGELLLSQIEDDFTRRKAISKIRDSFRVDKTTKDRILKYKQNINLSIKKAEIQI